MPKRITDSLRIRNNYIDFVLILLGFEENDQFIFYSPALALYAYGGNKEEAKTSFYETVELYLDYVVIQNTLENDLLRLGWRRHANIKSKFNPPKYDSREIMSKIGVNSFMITDLAADMQVHISA